MKQIIENLQQAIEENNGCEYHYGLEEAIRIIQAFESKPFDPELLGFELTKASQDVLNRYPDYNVLEYFFLKEEEYLIRYFKDESKIWILYRFNATENFKVLITLIKIPSHRFGVELLRNLGVIE